MPHGLGLMYTGSKRYFDPNIRIIDSNLLAYFSYLFTHAYCWDYSPPHAPSIQFGQWPVEVTGRFVRSQLQGSHRPVAEHIAKILYWILITMYSPADLQRGQSREGSAIGVGGTAHQVLSLSPSTGLVSAGGQVVKQKESVATACFAKECPTTGEDCPSP